ncbi:hypothetical protein [Spirulina sp. 06S082]|uniref:type II toxin-antitoxin system RelE family toxin n=1 Tax=Spirulina sp. 06S082 TaxID=3110248 RepID=UPI002B1EC448|nr:hypothetical protein [Spirulina sp. 06S082]MEA5467477.1 hypothetical protein [Spirulina sp. 06S082]
MEGYSVEFLKTAQKELSKLSKDDRIRIAAKILDNNWIALILIDYLILTEKKRDRRLFDHFNSCSNRRKHRASFLANAGEAFA